MVFGNFFRRPAVDEVTPQEARAKQKAGAIIVDVREPSEWREGHIPGAVHIPLGSLGRRYEELDVSQEIIAVCRSGSRSVSAVMILQQKGFSQVSSMSGGMILWMRQRFPVSSP